MKGMVPTLETFEQLREKGFRPQVVSCFVHEGKLLFMYDSKWKLWQLPQGGIEQGETAYEARSREIEEELGEVFHKTLAISEDTVTFLGEAKVEFPKKTQGDRLLVTKDGREIHMKGKKYFFYAIPVAGTEVEITDTEFQKYAWLTKEDALRRTQSIYQKGKKRITEQIIGLLSKEGFL